MAATRQSTFVDADGWVIRDDEEETAVSMFLAGIAPLPEDIMDFVRLWTIRAHLPALALGLASRKFEGDRYGDLCQPARQRSAR